MAVVYNINLPEIAKPLNATPTHITMIANSSLVTQPRPIIHIASIPKPVIIQNTYHFVNFKL